MAVDCLFCKIAAGEMSTELLLESENIVAFLDINPVAPTHILVVPKKHIISMAHLERADQSIMGEMVLAVSKLARLEGLDEGYRVVVNSGLHGGQTISHLHFHLLGGRSLKWPPG